METESSNSFGGTIISQLFKILLKIESALWYWLSVWLKINWRNTLHCTKRTQNKTQIIQWRPLKGFLASFHLWDYKFLHKRTFCLILFCVFKLKYWTGKSLIISLYLFLFFVCISFFCFVLFLFCLLFFYIFVHFLFFLFSECSPKVKWNVFNIHIPIWQHGSCIHMAMATKPPPILIYSLHPNNDI